MPLYLLILAAVAMIVIAILLAWLAGVGQQNEIRSIEITDADGKPVTKVLLNHSQHSKLADSYLNEHGHIIHIHIYDQDDNALDGAQINVVGVGIEKYVETNEDGYAVLNLTKAGIKLPQNTDTGNIKIEAYKESGGYPRKTIKLKVLDEKMA